MPDRRQPLDCMILHGCLQVCTLIIFNLCLCNCTETIQGIGLVGQCLERSASLLNFDWRTVHCLLGILRCFSLVSPCFSSVHRTLGTPKYHQATRRSTGPTDLDQRTWKSSASQQPTDIFILIDIWYLIFGENGSQGWQLTQKLGIHQGIGWIQVVLCFEGLLRSCKGLILGWWCLVYQALSPLTNGIYG
jgi:hypothetical protein